MHITPDLIRDAIASCSDRPTFVGTIDLSNASPAAVVVPVTLADEAAGGPYLTLVLRGAHLKDHAGEVGYPGGKPEPGDADLHATAAREMHEEIGVAPADLTWLGRLTPCPVITGRYLINPFVAAVRPEAAPRIASGEIARILTLPLLPYIRGERPIYAITATWHGASVLAPHFPLDGVVLYGATAYITYELISRVAAALGATMPPLIVQEARPWGDRYRREEQD